MLKDYAKLAIFLVIASACGGGDGSDIGVTTRVVTVSGDISFTPSANQFEVTSETVTDQAEDLFECQITLEKSTVIEYQLQSEDELTLRGQQLTRVASYEGADSVSGVDSNLFGTWTFGEDSVNGVSIEIQVTITPEELTYTNTCRI
ncbi:hypothetical protein [Pseudobacteriovorax antillogorgiicola]|uniref:Lipoprotein n=1 Tax=Pseudobacteriovorax antillogorgiicola TaxID=1513793 RepID=A0A1Y6C9M9_9BACT|nr:hypothetical protein [Pseudobacteriovorax antillogorgiicola]TCS51693.1 hypothetical protein EDD56_11078 [Pseudobacteriovorax antillogorgiicola]SMF49136.1 hypothetical protein SAMN06296036_11547 [Pseudobacteriovorax antillogorgiicola]